MKLGSALKFHPKNHNHHHSKETVLNFESEKVFSSETEFFM